MVEVVGVPVVDARRLRPQAREEVEATPREVAERERRDVRHVVPADLIAAVREPVWEAVDRGDRAGVIEVQVALHDPADIGESEAVLLEHDRDRLVGRHLDRGHLEDLAPVLELGDRDLGGVAPVDDHVAARVREQEPDDRGRRSSRRPGPRRGCGCAAGSSCCRTGTGRGGSRRSIDATWVRNESRSSTSASTTGDGVAVGAEHDGRLVVPAVGRARAPERAAARVGDRPAQRRVVGVAGVVVAGVELDAVAVAGRGGRRRTRSRRRGARGRARSRAAWPAAASWSQARRTAAGSATAKPRWCSRGPRPAVSATSCTVCLRVSQAPVMRSSGPVGGDVLGAAEAELLPEARTSARRRGEWRLKWSSRMTGAPRWRSKRCSCVSNCAISWKNSSGKPNGSQHAQRAPHARVLALAPSASRTAPRESAASASRSSSRADAEGQAGGGRRRRARAGRANGAGAPPSRADTGRRRRALAHDQPEQVDVEVLGASRSVTQSSAYAARTMSKGGCAGERRSSRRRASRRASSRSHRSPRPRRGIVVRPSATWTISVSQ